MAATFSATGRVRSICRVRAGRRPSAACTCRAASAATRAARPRSSTSRRCRRARRRRGPRAGRLRGRTPRRRRRCSEPAASSSPSSGPITIVPRDRKLREPGEHGAVRGLLGGVLVVPAEPARTGERRPLGRAREERAGTGRRGVAHARSSDALRDARSACSSTSSMTAPTASRCDSFSITGTSVRAARSSMYSWIIRISGRPAM